MDIRDPGLLWALTFVPFEMGVCGLALMRRLWRILPFFTAYLVLMVLVEAARLAVMLRAGYASHLYSWIYWMTQPLLILARGAALADVCRAALSAYSGIWQLARYLLAGATMVMLATAALRTGSTPGIASYVIYVERELEFAIVVTLLLLLVLSRYYGVDLNRPLGGIAMGLAFYSSVVITTSGIITGPVALPWWLFSAVRNFAYDVALGFWAYSLRRPISVPTRPELGTVEAYERDSRLVSDRMRTVNARLLELMKR
jgi:hypothetical protein